MFFTFLYFLQGTYILLKSQNIIQNERTGGISMAEGVITDSENSGNQK